VQAHAPGQASFTRSLAGLIGGPLVAFVAFVVGLAATSFVMGFWNSDVVYVLCFGTPFIAGLFVTARLSRSLSLTGRAGEAAALGALLFYFATVALLSLVLVGIIRDLRAG
jgi:hypothetical protein